MLGNSRTSLGSKGNFLMTRSSIFSRENAEKYVLSYSFVSDDRFRVTVIHPAVAGVVLEEESAIHLVAIVIR